MNWTLDADRILRILVDCGTHVDVIAEEFGCGVGEIVRRIRELKLPAVAAVDWVAGEKARCQLCEVELEEVDVHGCDFASKTGDEEVTILKFDCVCARCLLIVEEEVRKERPTSRTATPTKIYHSRGLVQLSRRRAQFCLPTGVNAVSRSRSSPACIAGTPTKHEQLPVAAFRSPRRVARNRLSTEMFYAL